MKKYLLIIILSFSAIARVAAQDDDQHGNEKIRDKMSEYIQKRLKLSEGETQKFNPVFLRYFREWRMTLRQNRGDRLVLQQKVIDLRLRYRTEFRELLGEKRGNQVFEHQDMFIREIKETVRERKGMKPLKNNRGML